MKLNKVLYSFLFAIMADFVLWDESVDYGYGFLLTFLYLAAVGLIVYHNRFAFKQGIGLAALIISGTSAFALLENISNLSVGMACFNLIVLSFLRNKDLDAGRLAGKVFKTIGTMIHFPYFRIIKRNSNFNQKYSIIKKSLLPFLFAFIFIILFSFINPLFLTLLEYIWDFIVEWINPLRIALFLVMTSVGFVLIRNRVKNVPSIFDFKNVLPNSGEFLSYRSICVSLVIFNAIFYAHVVTELYSMFFSDNATAVVSIATQAIDAAHVLLVVTLLAIVFISLTSSYDKQTEKMSFMRFFIIVWLIQNFILMVIGINYLSTFIKTEGLTYWRFSSVIWYGLIAIGLALTVIKIRYRKSLNWLVNWNAINVYITFTVLCFVNISAYIAEYNIDQKLSRWSERVYFDHKQDPLTGKDITIRKVYRTSEGLTLSDYYPKYGEDVLPVLIGGDHFVSSLGKEINEFVNRYNNSYRFWTYRRYRTMKAIENYNKMKARTLGDFKEKASYNLFEEKQQDTTRRSDQYIESGYNVSIVKNFENGSRSVSMALRG